MLMFVFMVVQEKVVKEIGVKWNPEERTQVKFLYHVSNE